MKHVTILFLRRKGELLLAMKKRGFGEGKWNGVGGKVESDETPEQAAIRECREEAGVTPRNLKKVCEIDFYLTAEPGFNNFAHIFIADEWDGEPHETEEMRPQWFPLDALPYRDMWGDDKAWLPLILDGQRFRSTFTLDDAEHIVHAEITAVPDGEDF